RRSWRAGRARVPSSVARWLDHPQVVASRSTQERSRQTEQADPPNPTSDSQRPFGGTLCAEHAGRPRTGRARMASDERPTEEPTEDRSSEVPIDEVEDDPEARLYSSVPLETDHGIVVIQQEAVGRPNEEGGGEWPDPHTPPRLPAPGAAPRAAPGRSREE